MENEKNQTVLTESQMELLFIERYSSATKSHPAEVDCSQWGTPNVIETHAMLAKKLHCYINFINADAYTEDYKEGILKKGGEYVSFETVQTPNIVFYKGDEAKVVIEEDHFDTTIFKDQYALALNIFNKIWHQDDDKASNIIAFCGNRGDGKTSCMETVSKIIADKNVFERYLDANHLQKSDFEFYKEEKFVLAPVIDPAFFDDYHNVIELVLGLMYDKVVDEKYNQRQDKMGDRTDLIKQFREVKRNLSQIDIRDKKDTYDPLEELGELAAGVKLRTEIADLFERYNKYFEVKKIIICIDDIDLNMKFGYRMVEQMRKYLNNNHCVVLLSVKIDQLTNVIYHTLKADINGGDSESDLIYTMARKYVTKLLPESNRVQMCHVEDICNRSFALCKHDQKPNEGRVWPSLREAIPQLIYEKTRYLFYNSRNEVSLIVPNNLREIRHLVALLDEMPDFQNNKYHKANKDMFKAYFYQTWIQCLDEDDLKFAKRVIVHTNISSLNWLVVDYLVKQNFAPVGRSGLLADKMLARICAKTNNVNNISFGDVFYIISKIESITFDEATKRLLFFIKSVYSMRLYEYYDVITEQPGQLYPSAAEDAAEIYKYETAYEHVNVLQEFVNGPFYYYEPAMLMAYEAKSRQPRDLQVVDGKKLLKLINAAKEIAKKKDTDITDDEQKVFRRCEFFLLTILRPVNSKDVKDYDFHKRTAKEQSAYQPFTNYDYGFVFDVLAPFYNLINPKFTYNRFELTSNVKSDVNTERIELFDFALDHDWTLLSQMIQESLRANKEETFELLAQKQHNLSKDKQIHRLQSAAIIRNVDVYLSLWNLMLVNRTNNSKGKPELTWRVSNLYQSILNSHMRTYYVSKDVPYLIQFKFLNALISYLSTEAIGPLKIFLPSPIPQHWLGEAVLEQEDNEEEKTEGISPRRQIRVWLAKVVNFRNYKEARTRDEVIKLIEDNYQDAYKNLLRNSPEIFEDVFPEGTTYTNSTAVVECLVKRYDTLKSVFENNLPF